MKKFCTTVAVCTLFLVACSTPHLSHAVDIASATAAAEHSPSVMNLRVFDWLFGVCILLAAASVLLAAFRFPVPPKLTLTLVAIAAAAVAGKLLLVKYEWLLGLLCIAGVCLACIVFALTRLNWLEKKLGRDFNRDGKIGGKP